MFRKSRPLFFICNTPTHVGSGSELGVVDLPIQRERHTGFPKFEASSIKGSLREAVERRFKKDDYDNWEKLQRVFGYDGDGLDPTIQNRFKGKNGEDETQFAGAIGFTDARLLLFPVKSMKGVFAWVTCFRVLKQFAGDMQLAAQTLDRTFEFVGLDEDNLTLAPGEVFLFNPDASVKVGQDKVILEEFTFVVSNELNGDVQVKIGEQKSDFPDWLAGKLFGGDGSYWSEKIKKDIIVLHDDDFKDFVNLSTEVITRTKIDNETGTVAQGALFNEEYLPAESVLYTIVLSADEFRKEGMAAGDVYEFFKANLPEVVQIGANATLGKGIVTTKIVEL